MVQNNSVFFGDQNILCSRKDLLNVPQVFSKGVPPNYDFVEIHVTNLSIERSERSEGRTHASLVSGRRISTTHLHDKPFIESKRSCYRCETDIIRMDAGLKKRVGDINFCPEFTPRTVH